MKDTYKDFKSLSAVQKEGTDFQLFVNKTNSRKGGYPLNASSKEVST